MAPKPSSQAADHSPAKVDDAQPLSLMGQLRPVSGIGTMSALRPQATMMRALPAVLSEAELLRAMFDVGYFPPNTPPG
jgi:hypothetical protein